MSNKSFDPTQLQEDRKRVEQMNRWYKLDGRDNKKHKFHGLFTGLKKISKKLELLERMSNAYDANKKYIP
tara:strand:+ start:155 stop:364 length:210 start_codon:yes stop_codon:yes gene_type:complete